MEPNRTSFLLVIHCLAAVGDVHGAKEVLQQMISLQGVISDEPDISCFNAILEGLAKSKNPSAVRDIENALVELEKTSDMPPDAVSYTCCTRALGSLAISFSVSFGTVLLQIACPMLVRSGSSQFEDPSVC